MKILTKTLESSNGVFFYTFHLEVAGLTYFFLKSDTPGLNSKSYRRRSQSESRISVILKELVWFIPESANIVISIHRIIKKSWHTVPCGRSLAFKESESRAAVLVRCSMMILNLCSDKKIRAHGFLSKVFQILETRHLLFNSIASS